MAKLAIFKPPELYKKLSEVKYLFSFELRKSISSMGYKKITLKNIISIGENWLNKKNHTERQYFVFFESRNN